MEKTIRLKLLLELTWWVLTALVAYLVLLPIHKATGNWPFEAWNIACIVIVLTFTRYIFLLKHTFLAKRQILKLAIILLIIPLTFFVIEQLNYFLTYVGDNTWEPITGHLPQERKKAIESYMWTEMIFFGAGSIITGPALMVRLLISIWRTHNRGTV